MKTLAIIGAGTGGTIVANRMQRALPPDWRVVIVDPRAEHLYQPGLLFLPFGARNEAELTRPIAGTLAPGVVHDRHAVERVDTARKRVELDGGGFLDYDLLVIASGAEIRPDLLPGLLGPGWRVDRSDFYTLEGALALRELFAGFRGGRVVVNVVEMPIKCPVAPLELLFLADAYFRRRGLRERVELVFATPLDGAFTRPVAARTLGGLLASRNILVETELLAQEVDPEQRLLRAYDGRELAFDLLVTIPTHTGAAFVERSGLGDELRFIPTDRHTLAAVGHEDVFVLGDATNLPSSKAGSVAHFQAELLVENLRRVMTGGAPEPTFDGHANCFVETGDGKAMLIDFNYDVEPLPGEYPVPGVGPFSLLKESRRNHWGKLAFRWLYWNALLPGRPLPVPPRMSMRGKRAA